ncbi:DUF2187 family protein [Priestia abyssalis]|uniref:DUF2187 family protein n=1 Tax=Priestia abyssalis TaxID=1221450 RepID=UPI0009954900|nr:DUF2187 family protein [Priestia abyssalis]
MKQPKESLHNHLAVKIGDRIKWEREVFKQRQKEIVALTGEVIKINENSVIVKLLDPALTKLLRIESDLTNVRHNRYNILPS